MKKLTCQGIMMRVFLKSHNQKKRFFPFARDWKMWARMLSFHKREGRRSSGEKNIHFFQDVLVHISWGKCLIRWQLMRPFWEIFNFRSSDGMHIQWGLGTFLDVSCESNGLFAGVLKQKAWLAGPDRGLFSKFEDSFFWRCLFQ